MARETGIPVEEQELISHYDHHIDYTTPMNNSTLLMECVNDLKIKLRQDDLVVDMGCGTGLWVYYASRICQAIGVDYSSERIRYARNRWVRDDRFQFVCSPIQNYTFPVDVSIITFWEVLEHLVDPLPTVLRALGTGAKIYGSVPLDKPYVAHFQVYESVEQFEESFQGRLKAHLWREKILFHGQA